MIVIKRIYGKPHKKDGFRILVDRLWPRGLSKDKARVDLRLKEIAPSDALRKWFAHDPRKWGQFSRKYRAELRQGGELIKKIKRLEREKGTITLLFSAKDEKRNTALVLKEVLQE